MKPMRVHGESFWTRRSGLLSIAVVLVVSVLDYMLDSVLGRQGVSRGYMLVVASATTGIVAGGLFFQMAKHEKAQRELVRQRVKTIAELNHHIRNALQVIKLCGAQPSAGIDAKQLQLIKESADRIEWALREVLPKYPAEAGNVAREPQTGYGVAPPSRTIGAFSDPHYQP